MTDKPPQISTVQCLVVKGSQRWLDINEYEGTLDFEIEGFALTGRMLVSRAADWSTYQPGYAFEAELRLDGKELLQASGTERYIRQLGGRSTEVTGLILGRTAENDLVLDVGFPLLVDLDLSTERPFETGAWMSVQGLLDIVD